MNFSKNKRKGFTLVELLVVVGIIVIIAAISMAGMTDLNKTAEYAEAGSTILGKMHMARQIAIAKNEIVEVRFYKNEQTGGTELWQAMAVVTPPASSTDQPAPEGEPYFLPDSLAIDPDPERSSLLDPSLLPALDPFAEEDEVMGAPLVDSPSIYGKMDGKEYVVFRYYPDGTTNLNLKDKWFLTVREKQEILRADAGGTDQLANFSTIILNPYTGRGSIYRP